MLGRSKLQGVRRSAKQSGYCRRNSMLQSSRSWSWRAHWKLRALPIPSASFPLWLFSPHTEIQGLLHMCAYCAFTSRRSPMHCRHDWHGRKGSGELRRVEMHSSRAISALVEKGLQVLHQQIYCRASWQKRYCHCNTRQRWRRGGAWPHSPPWDMTFGGWCGSGMEI